MAKNNLALWSGLVLVALVGALYLAGGASASDVCGKSTSSDPIQYIFVLMFENRSFDHFLGWLKQQNDEIIGLTGKEFNYVDPSDPTSRKVFVDQNAQDVDPDFDHGVAGVTQEIQWGSPSTNDGVTQAMMNGFVAQNIRHVGQTEGPLAVSMFNSTTLPVLSTLAVNFANFDQYFCDVPGPTMPNRFYFMSGTSHGLDDNNQIPIAEGLPQHSIFDRLNEWNIDWRVYQETVASVLGLLRMREPHNLERVRDLVEFFKDVESERIQPFTWIEPSYWAIPEIGMPARDQHPSHPVSNGEELLKRVYESIRQSPYWDCSAFIVTYDEHGGFADFNPMEITNVPNPDGRNAQHPTPFTFDRLGIRVPFVIASPWVDASVVHQPPTSVRPASNSQFSHSSLAATLQHMFDPTGKPLTNRTAWSAPYDYVWKQRTSPRTDCPSTLPSVHVPNFFKDKDPFWSASHPMNSFQLELLGIARQMCLDSPAKCTVPVPSMKALASMTEGEGGMFAVSVMRSLGLLRA
jgi:phospholipase C